MLQQTQVDRVKGYFEKWMRIFPDVASLAHAPLTSVLKEWQGLGYNRRAKLLRACAQVVCEKGGVLPRDFESLMSLPGIGPYTAGAIRAFAFDEPTVLIETNIRAALINHFFPRTKSVPDARLIPIIEELLLHTQSPRVWYSAFMDYGSHIKKTHPNPSRRSTHHTRQARFEGSLRQIRGALIRKLIEGPIREAALLKINVADSYRIEQALKSLERDGMIMKKKGRWHLAG